MKRLIRKILREHKSDKHYRILDIISDHVQLPYFKSMEGLTIYEHNDQEYIMKKILGDDIRIKGREIFYYGDNGNERYYEEYSGDHWVIWEYDDDGVEIYYEDSDGYWEKWEYDDIGNEIYYEDSNGVINDNR